MSFNLKSFDTIGNADRGSTLHFRNPETGDLAYNGDVPLTITIKGLHGNEALRIEAEQLARKRREKGKSQKKDDYLTFEDIQDTREMLAEKFARLSTGWTGFPDESGEGLEPFSVEKAKEMFMTYSDLLQQAKEWSSEKKNYPAQ